VRRTHIAYGLKVPSGIVPKVTGGSVSTPDPGGGGGTPVTPGGTWPKRVLFGMSTDIAPDASRQAKWERIDGKMLQALKDVGYTGQTGTVNKIRHTFGSGMFPATFNGSQAQYDPGLGVKYSVLNGGRHDRTWVSIKNEYDDWKDAAKPDPTTNATKYVFGNACAKFVKSCVEQMPVGHTMYLTGLHEPGLSDTRSDANTKDVIWGNTTDQRRYFHPDAQALWCNMQAYITEVTLNLGQGRVFPCSVIQGAEVQGFPWPVDATGGGANSGTKRSMDNYDYSYLLNSAQLKDTIFGLDSYLMHPTPKPGPILKKFNDWRVGKGYGYSAMAETGKPKFLDAQGNLMTGEPQLLARSLGDPTWVDGYRHYFDNAPEYHWVFSCWFESGVMTATIFDANNPFIEPFPPLMAAYGEACRNLDYTIAGLANRY
jgi:hypothetical protein